MGKCALCGLEKELQLSHIIPKFVGKYLKETSIGNIRNQNNPNKVVQDIEKHYLLCHECEELFSASERYFANTVFYPYHRDNKDEFTYTNQLFYFITSLSWRSLYLDIINFVKEGTIDIEKLEKMITSEQVMRDFLLKKRSDLANIEHHIFFFDRVKSVSHMDSIVDKGKNFNVAIHRALQSYSGYADNTIYTISNLMGIILITLYSKDEDEKWNRTQINNGKGCLYAKNQEIASRLGAEFGYWMNQKEEAVRGISAATKDKIEKKIRDVGEDIKNYSIYQDIIDDLNIEIK